MPAYTEYLGVIARPHGVDGAMVLTDVVVVPTSLGPGSTVAVGFAREFTRTFTLEAFSQTPERTTIKLTTIGDREGAQALVDQAVYFDASQVLAPSSNRFSVADIVGCTVHVLPTVEADASVDSNTVALERTPSLPVVLGTITDVMLLPANDVWVVTTPDKQEILLPVIDSVVKDVDVQGKVVSVVLIEGLLDPDTDETE